MADESRVAQNDATGWLDDQAIGRCDTCGRKTWDGEMIGRACYMPQPDGNRCSSVIRTIEPEEA